MTSSQIANRYRVVVVDEEPLARDGLRDAVERMAVPGVAVVALCENGVVALDRIRELQPEILLLDVAMPVLDGFAMLEQLEPETPPPAVIFVTAYDEHAVRRVAEARALRAGLEAEPPPIAAGRYVQQLVIPDRGRRLVVPVDEVEWIEGDTYYVRVHAQGRVRLLRERLSHLEASLDPARFHRTHRSALVRLDLIRELRADSPYTYSALLSTGARVPVSRERVKQLEARLKV
jgi:two-component system LytT family response regulator